MRASSLTRSAATILSLVLPSTAGAGTGSAQLSDLKVVGHRFSTQVLGNPRDLSVKDATKSRFVVLSVTAQADAPVTLFAPDFVLAYSHQDDSEDRADCKGIMLRSGDYVLDGEVARVRAASGPVEFILVFNIEPDVREIELVALRGSATRYSVGASRPFSVFVTTNRPAGPLRLIERELRDGGYHVDTSEGLGKDKEGLTIIYPEPLRADARDISQRLTNGLKVNPKLKTFADMGINASSYDLVVWVGQ